MQTHTERNKFPFLPRHSKGRFRNMHPVLSGGCRLLLEVWQCRGRHFQSQTLVSAERRRTFKAQSFAAALGCVSFQGLHSQSLFLLFLCLSLCDCCQCICAPTDLDIFFMCYVQLFSNLLQVWRGVVQSVLGGTRRPWMERIVTLHALLLTHLLLLTPVGRAHAHCGYGEGDGVDPLCLIFLFNIFPQTTTKQVIQLCSSGSLVSLF